MIELALLGGGIEFAEAGFALQGAVLFGRGEILVVFDPLREMAFALRNCCSPCGGGPDGERAIRLHAILRPGRSSRGSGGSLRSCRVGERESSDQEEDTCAADVPGWKMRTHNRYDSFKRKRDLLFGAE